jgi:hypothetical protein
MGIPATTINIHHVHRVAARSQHSLGAPVTLRCAGTEGNGDTEVTIYLGDQDLADRLVTAINHAMRPVPPKAVPSDEVAAYGAADDIYAYRGGAR